jgi:hypothetical protein
MREFIKHFRSRVQATQGSRFYPGTSFMDIDLASWLERGLGGQPPPGRPSPATDE